jgi:hypothetical protein
LCSASWRSKSAICFLGIRDLALLFGYLLSLLADLLFLVSHSRRTRSFSLADLFACRSRERALIHHAVTDWQRFAQPP